MINSLSDDDLIMMLNFLIFFLLCFLSCIYIGKLWRLGELFKEDIVYLR